jgi:hypothetical protein
MSTKRKSRRTVYWAHPDDLANGKIVVLDWKKYRKGAIKVKITPLK